MDQYKIKPLPTDEAMEKFNEERAINGYVFPLTATSIGLPDDEMYYARVRRVATLDRAVMLGLPADLQETLFEGINEFSKAMDEARKKGQQEPKNLLEMMANNDKIIAAADTFCKAAFIYPRLFDTTEEVRAFRGEPGEVAWRLDRVHAEDRVAVLMLSLDADSPQIKKLKMFRPEFGLALHDEQDMPVAPNPLRVLETAGAGVHGDRTEGV